MNINNLKLNNKYKYKSFCEVLEIEQKKSTNSKKSQLKELQQYMNVIKDGTWYTVTEIYLDTKEKVDNRKGNSGTSEGSRGHNNTYGEYLDILIENRLYTTLHNRKDKDNKIIYITNACLAELTKMVNFNYRTCNMNREKFHKYMYGKYASKQLAEQDIFFKIYGKIRPAITSSLNRLQSSGKIIYKSDYIISYNDYLDKQANDLQKTVIESAEKQVMKDMKITNKQKLWNMKIRKQFYEKCNEMVMNIFNKQDETIEGYYQGYIINIKDVHAQENVKTLEIKLNKTFTDNIKESIINHIEKIKDDGWGGSIIPRNTWDRKRVTLKYKTSIEYCIEVLLSFKTLNITDRINYMKTDKQIEIENNKLYEELKASGIFDFN